MILGHLGGTRGFKFVDLKIGDYSHLGVVVFFVISGFLITSLLTSEFESHGRVSLKLFYARRSLRIFPASYTYVAVISLLWALSVIHLRPTDIWHAVTYTVNYEPGHSWQVAHLWSLSVEEQFYLLWPFAFVAFGPRKATWAAVWVIFIAIFARTANRVILIDTQYHDLNMFPMVADSLAMGCLLARMRGWLEGQDWYLRLFRPGWSLLILGLVLLLNRYEGYTVVIVLGTSLINLGLAILIHRSVYHPNDWVGRILNWKPLAMVGVLSYSLYVWQQLFVNRNSSAWMNAFPENLIFAILAALASYLIIEKPLLKWRHRLHAQSVAKN